MSDSIEKIIEEMRAGISHGGHRQRSYLRDWADRLEALHQSRVETITPKELIRRLEAGTRYDLQKGKP